MNFNTYKLKLKKRSSTKKNTENLIDIQNEGNNLFKNNDLLSNSILKKDLAIDWDSKVPNENDCESEIYASSNLDLVPNSSTELSSLDEIKSISYDQKSLKAKSDEPIPYDCGFSSNERIINILETPKSKHEPGRKIKKFNSFSLNESCNKVRTKIFDQNVQISENPFDILEGNFVKSNKPKSSTIPVTKKLANDTIFLDLLQREKKTVEKTEKRQEGIFSEIKIISNVELELESKKYYKFPFEMGIVNDNSKLFGIFKTQFHLALNSSYSNYRKFKEEFKVLTNDGLIIFGNGLLVSKTLQKQLKDHDIEAIDINNDNFYKVEESEAGMLFDFALNLEITKGKPIPFILSDFEFENGIVYRTKIIKGSVVRSSSKANQIFQYSYSVKGPVYAADFEFGPDSTANFLN